MLTTVMAAAFLAVALGAMAADSSRQLRVGLVLEQPVVTRAGDPFQYGAYQGLLRAARDLHIQAKTAEPKPTGGGDQYLAAMTYLARQHYDLVIALGTFEVSAVARAARLFPHEKFVLLDGARQLIHKAPANLEGTDFHVEQAAFLAGFLAARMVDRLPRPHVVSSVAGVPIGTVQAYVAGFQAGAKRADPKIRLLNAYTYDFVNQARCRHAALSQIAHGSQVVFDVAGACGLGALEVAKRKGVFGIGVDIDQHYLGKFILTSVVKNLNAAVYDLAKRLVAGRLRTGGNLSFDLRDRGVGLGAFSPQVPRTLRRELIPLAAQIRQEKIVVPTTLSR
ncbi:MAG TPA: BMP family ABC transporter substrate-binding protein [Gaiellaceae bacterium]|nr:BMP family ABC transporter substrate-binding protein [Gaiellaceae bacterium]